MADRMPYFRCYADTWRARLQELDPKTQLFVLQALLTCWGDERGGARQLPATAWARKIGVSADELKAVLAELTTCPWIQVITVDGFPLVTVSFPELEEQAAGADKEAEYKRNQRAKAQTGQRVDRSLDKSRTRRWTSSGQGIGQRPDTSLDNARTGSRTKPGQVSGPSIDRSIDRSNERRERERDRSIDGSIDRGKDGSSEPDAGSAGLGPAGVVSPKTEDPPPSELPASRPVSPPLKAPPRWIPAASSWLSPGTHPTYRNDELPLEIGEFGGYAEMLHGVWRICEFTAATGAAFRLLWDDSGMAIHHFEAKARAEV